MRRLLALVVLLAALVSSACNRGNSKEAFCERSREVEREFEDVFAEADTPQEFRAAFRDISAAIDDLVELAPDEIKDDAETVRDNLRRQREVLEKYDYDFTKVPQNEQQALQDEDAQKASERLEKYNSDECGISNETDTTS